MAMPQTTAAVGFERFGGPEVLQVLSVPVRRPGTGEILVEVAATAVNPADTLFRSGGVTHLLDGHDPPFVPGLELTGVVADVGPGVEDLLVGQLVMAITSFIPTGRGAQRGFVVVPSAAAVPVPAGLDPVAASTLPMNGLTARLALDRAGARDGAVAVTGAAGAVGGYVVQLAAAEGRRVIALAAEADHDVLRAMGADAVAAVTDGDVAAAIRSVHDGPVDVIVDAALLGQPCTAAVREGGRIIALRPADYGGGDPGGRADVDVQLISVREYGTDRARLQGLADMAARGDLTLRVATTLPPDRAAEAHRMVDAGGMRGRPVLVW